MIKEGAGGWEACVEALRLEDVFVLVLLVGLCVLYFEMAGEHEGRIIRGI